MNHKRLRETLFAGSVVLTAVCSISAEGQNVPIEFNQVVFRERFDNYEKDKPLQRDGEWDSIMTGRPEERCAWIRADTDSLFGQDKENQYLLVRDNDESSPIRILAKDIADLNSTLVRLSFDAYKPKDSLDGVVAIAMGINDVSARSGNQTVGGIQIEPPDRLMPVGGGAYEPGRKFHVDIYFNETDEKITYLTADGKESTLRPGLMDIWIDGRLKGAGKTRQRDRNDPTAIKSLLIETYTAPRGELYLDNLEIAIPQKGLILG